MCVSGNGSENLGRIGTHIFFNYFFKMPLKKHKKIFFPENLKKFLGFTSKFR